MPKTKKTVTIPGPDPSKLAVRLRAATPPFSGKWDLQDPSLHAYAICMQRVIRGFLGKLHFERHRCRVLSAIAIQRRMRGYLCRVSEQYILAQVYMRLPSFWKEIMKSGVPRDTNIQLQNDAQILRFLGNDLNITMSTGEGSETGSPDGVVKRKKKKVVLYE